jgi:hypothetical protein
MAGPDGVSSNNRVTLEGKTLSGPATGPSISSYRTAGGVYTEIYNDVGRRLGTTSEPTILREIQRQYDAQMVDQRNVRDTAQSIVDAARESSIFGDSINTETIAARILEIRRDNPGRADEIERQVFIQLSDAGDQSRLSQDLATAANHIPAADARIATLGPEGAMIANGPVIGRAELTAQANALIEASTDRVAPNRGNPRGSETLNVQELAYQVERIAADNPRLAQTLRADLSARLGAVDAAAFNRVLAGDTSFGEGVGRAFAHPVDGAIGVGKGIANGVIALGDLFARGSTLQAAGQQQQAAAFASLFGNEEQAAAHRDMADGMRTVAGSEMIPQIPYSNIAQSGGGDVGTVVDVAMAGKGIVTGGARLLARNADDIAGVAGRQTDEVGGAALRVTDEVIAERTRIATEFYTSQGFDAASIPDHLKGIDFSQPVEVVPLPAGTRVIQYQVPGGRQGSYYAPVGTPPGNLGIAAQGTDRATGAIVDKVANVYVLTEEVSVLRSSANAVNDTWSIRGQVISTAGGGTQYFTTGKAAFEAVR